MKPEPKKDVIGVASHALCGFLNGVTDADICYICKHPVAGIGSPFCSAPHLASRFKCRIDQLEASLREMIDLNETTGDPDPEITERARALLLPNDLAHLRATPKA